MSNTSNSTAGLFLIRVTVLAAIVLGIVASIAGAGAGQDKAGLRFAIVNPGKLIAEYKYAVQSRKELEKLDNDAKVAINTWGRFPLLSTVDQDSLVKLVLKETQTPNDMTKAEKDAEAALKTKHDNLLKEYNDLLGKPNGATTAQDAQRLDALNKLRNDTDVRIKAKQKDAGDDISKKEEEFNVKIDKDIRDALNKVAKDKGMNLVFSSQVVLFADTDITDDVIKQLNR